MRVLSIQHLHIIYTLYFLRCNISISRRADVYERRININSLSQFRGAHKACFSSSLRSSCRSINVYVTSMASAMWNSLSYSHQNFMYAPFDVCAPSRRRRRTFARPCIGDAFRRIVLRPRYSNYARHHTLHSRETQNSAQVSQRPTTKPHLQGLVYLRN